jgi:hypothetical protein
MVEEDITGTGEGAVQSQRNPRIPAIRWFSNKANAQRTICKAERLGPPAVLLLAAYEILGCRECILFICPSKLFIMGQSWGLLRLYVIRAAPGRCLIETSRPFSVSSRPVVSVTCG